MLLIYVFIIGSSHAFRALDNLKPSASPGTQEEAVRQLMRRTIKEDATRFSVKVTTGLESKDYFQIQNLKNGTVYIIGTTGVAAATGFHHYLKYYCNSHISWEISNIDLPDILPDVNVTIVLNDRFRYYQNVCTASYSFVWWDWEQWQKHIDWMALNSFNLVLAYNGLESVWKKVYQQMNLTTEEIDEHFTGPAFLAWGRMGNIRGWGGPLSNFWHRRSLELQHLILKQMREIGIIPVLPAFDGHVPRAFTRLFPQAKINTTSVWNKFEDKYCCPYLLDPTDPLFQAVGTHFLREIISEFGTDHAYSSDTFNEMDPSSGEPSYLSKIGQSVYAAMETVDPKAIWIMQNWLFVHDFAFWSKSRAKALLTSVPQGKMIVLDLQSEQFPQYRRLDSYFGQPYIWCMLHNFGGTLGMFGSAKIINEEVFKARNEPNNTLVGTGVTAEGINQNYVVYDLMTEMAWRKCPTNLTAWFSHYAERRYGKHDDNIDAAWQLFKNTVYNFAGGFKMRGKYVFNQRPRTHITTRVWYNTTEFFRGWSLFIQPADAFKNSAGYLHDLVDTTRQFLQILGDQYYPNIVNSFRSKDIGNFQYAASMFLDIFEDMDRLLATNEAYLLGVWLNASKSLAFTKEDEKLFEYNARNQITLWGPKGEIVDYANKQWAGVVSKFFLPRWKIFLKNMNNSLLTDIEFNETQTIRQIFSEVEEPFTFDRTVFPNYPIGNTIEVAKYIHSKWLQLVRTRSIRNDVYFNSFDEAAPLNEDYADSPLVIRTL